MSRQSTVTSLADRDNQPAGTLAKQSLAADPAKYSIPKKLRKTKAKLSPATMPDAVKDAIVTGLGHREDIRFWVANKFGIELEKLEASTIKAKLNRDFERLEAQYLAMQPIMQSFLNGPASEKEATNARTLFLESTANTGIPDGELRSFDLQLATCQ